MGIVDEDIVRVRQTADIVAVVSQHTQLRKVGQRWSGLCPFHQEKSPSFSVNGVDGLYYCFGCRAKGDVITFVREIEHLDFVGAVEWLANRFGVTLHYTEADEGATRKRQKQLRDTMERAVGWYHERLLTGGDAGPARAYLRSRGFDRDMVDQYRLGWAPDDWDQLCRHLRVSEDVLVDCGLGFRNKAGRQQDFFRGRVLFPIFDDQGRPVAFGGRKLPGADGPKYQNSRENALYNKSRTLYGLNWAKGDVVQSGEVVVCEGYTDVIGFFRAGVPRAVATCGTSLTEEHVRSLKRFTSRVVLAYDADEAGQAASERVYEWEQRHEIQVSVIRLPPGDDPDELSRSNPELLVQSVAEARPMLGFRVDRVLEGADLSSPEGRSRAATQAVAVIAEHPSALVRDQYLLQVAATCRTEPDLLREELANPRTRAKVAAARAAAPARHDDGDPGHDDDGDPFLAGLAAERPAPVRESAELEALRLLVHRRPDIEGWLRPALFGDERTRAAYVLVAAQPDLHAALEDAPTALGDLLARLAVEESTADVTDVVVRLTQEAVRRAIGRLEREAKVSEDPLAFTAAIQWLILQQQALAGEAVAPDELLTVIDWLAEHGDDR